MQRTKPEQSWERLKDQLVEALTGLYGDLKDPAYRASEQEILSLLAFRHLPATLRRDRPLFDLAQLGLAVALPPLPGVGARQRTGSPDLVIWPRPAMTCWDSGGRARQLPLALLELTCVNNVGPADRGHKKRTKFESDINEMKARTAQWTDLTGFCVYLERAGAQPTPFEVRVIRADTELQLPIGG